VNFKPLLLATFLISEAIYYVFSGASEFKPSLPPEPEMALKRPSVIRAERAAAEPLARPVLPEMVTARAEDGSLSVRWKKP
jgi:hypothetical protein